MCIWWRFVSLLPAWYTPVRNPSPCKVSTPLLIATSIKLGTKELRREVPYRVTEAMTGHDKARSEQQH